MTHLPEEQFVDPTDWKTVFFSELDSWQDLFITWDIPIPFAAQREKRAPFSALVKDLVSLALAEKKGAFEGLSFLSQDSSSPTTTA